MKPFLALLFLTLLTTPAFSDCTLVVDVRDTIGPATYDYLQQAQGKAQKSGCSSILAKINTPGGSLQSTRKIVEMIMASPIPYLCVIQPAGGHAGSAGAIIMQACHVNGAFEATNIGAASPITGSGTDIPEDLKKKVFEDTRSWVEGLAKFRGRNVEFAREIVLDAKALDAHSALEKNAIDSVVTNNEAFLTFAKGREVRMKADEKLAVNIGPLVEFPPGMRHEVLQVLSNPQWAYLIFMGSLGLLYFEMTHPGVILPGVVGAIGLTVSFINFHLLDASWGGVVLILLGVAFMFAEIFVPSFGALGLGGLASFVVGSLLLFDERSGYQIPLSLLVSTSLCLFLVMFGLSYVAVKATKRGFLRRKKESMDSRILVVKSFDHKKKHGMGFVQGELWQIESQDHLKEGDSVKVVQVNGLILTVSHITEGEV